MKYEFDRLGSGGFEKLVQSLMMGIYGTKCRVYGDGPDGQREIVVDDAGGIEIVENVKPSGKLIGQVKFKSADGKEDDWTWLRHNIKCELDGFRKKKRSIPDYLPKTLLFFVNIVLTPVLNTGIKDKADSFVSAYKDIIPEIYILGIDEIRTMLDNNRDVAACYSAFIMPGDVLRDLKSWIDDCRRDSFETLMEYANQCFNGDHDSRMEHTGSVEKRIPLRKVYTDIEARERGSNRKGSIGVTASIVAFGDVPHPRIPRRKHEESINGSDHANIVLLGGAGHGKSTLCQYICQIYRAALLRRFREDVELSVDYSESDTGIPVPKCERFPMLIKLKDFTEWRAHRDADETKTVVAFLVYLINKRTSGNMTVVQFKQQLRSYSWIFLFDGLDEVPFSANRTDVLAEMAVFVNEELPAEHCDAVIIATSRPQGYNNDFPPESYRHFELVDMSPTLCEKYFSRLIMYAEDSIDNQEKYMSVLRHSLEDPMVSKLMKTPLHTSIIVMIVMKGDTPPTRRYDLFHRYCDLVIQREKEKRTLPDLREEHYVGIHAELGFLLQKRSENVESAAAELSRDECITVIQEYYKENGFQKNCPAPEDIYIAMTTRLTFIAEAVGDAGNLGVSFVLRSMQEYFAAERLITISENELSDKLEVLAMNAYWRNVFLFIAGYFAKHFLQFRNINKAIIETCAYCNAEAHYKPNYHELCKKALPGSWLALDLLCEDILQNERLIERCMGFVSEIFALHNVDLDRLMHFSALPQERANELIDNYIESNEPYDTDTTLAILWILTNTGNKLARDKLDQLLLKNTWPRELPIQFMLTSWTENIGPNAADAMYRWCMQTFFTNLVYTDNDALWKNYSSFLKSYMKLKGLSELPSEMIRQLVYCCIISNRFFPTIASLLPRDINGKERLRILMGRTMYGHDEFYYAPIVKENKYKTDRGLASAFTVRDIHELAALTDYVVKPTYENLKVLIDSFALLNQDERACFSLVVRRYDWLLKKIVKRLEEGTTVQELTLEITPDYFFDCLKKDADLKRLVDENNPTDIALSGYIGTELSPFLLVGKASYCDTFLNTLCDLNDANIAMFDDFYYVTTIRRRTKAVLRYAKQYQNALWQSNDGGSGLMNLVCLGRRTVNTLLDFGVPHDVCAYLYVGMGQDGEKRLVQTAESIMKNSDSYPEVMALLTPLLISAETISLKPLSVESYRAVKKTGNPAALFGAINVCIRCNSSDLTNDEICCDLKDLLNTNEEMCCEYLNWGMRRFSLYGLQIVLNATKDYETRDSINWINRGCERILLKKLETQSIPDEVLTLNSGDDEEKEN